MANAFGKDRVLFLKCSELSGCVEWKIDLAVSPETIVSGIARNKRDLRADCQYELIKHRTCHYGKLLY